MLDYPERYGPAVHRALIAERYETVGDDGVLITSGLDEGLRLIFSALDEPADRVIVRTPCYPPQRELPE